MDDETKKLLAECREYVALVSHSCGCLYPDVKEYDKLLDRLNEILGIPKEKKYDLSGT